MIDSPGLIEMQHQLVLCLVSGQARTPAEIANIVVKTTPAGTLVRVGDVAVVRPSVMPVYTVVTANAKPAVLLNIYRQPDSNTVRVADAVHAEVERLRRDLPKAVRPGAVLRPIGPGQRFHQKRARRHPDRPGAGLADHGAVPARLGHVAGGGPGDSGHHRGHLHRAARAQRDLQPDDAGRSGGGGGPGDRRRHRGGGEHRAASRFRPVARARRSAARSRKSASRWWAPRSRRSWSSCR